MKTNKEKLLKAHDKLRCVYELVLADLQDRTAHANELTPLADRNNTDNWVVLLEDHLDMLTDLVDDLNDGESEAGQPEVALDMVLNAVEVSFDKEVEHDT